MAGIAKDEIIDGSSALAEIKRRAINNPEYSNLPRKFKTALTGHPSHDVAPEVNDVSFVGTVHPELGPGFDMWVGGGLSTNPMLAQKLGVWIPLDEVPTPGKAWPRSSATTATAACAPRPRLKFLVADWGLEKFREVLETEYLHRALVDNPSPPTPVTQGDHIGIHEQQRRQVLRRCRARRGPDRRHHAERLGDLVEKYGALGARLTAYQKLVVLGVDADDTEAFADDLEKIGLTARPSNWRRNTMACTGIEFCKLAIVDTKERSRRLVTELEKRFPDLDTPITVNVNGCPNACARTQVADIGLKGQLVHGRRRQPGRGLPGAPRWRARAPANFGRKLRAHKITSAGLDDYITQVVSAYLDDRTVGRELRDVGRAGRRGPPARGSRLR